MKPKGDKKSAAQVAREYLEARPALRKILLRGLINQAALARTIMEDEGQTNEEAVTTALRRFVQEKGASAEGQDEAIRNLLSSSSLNMKNRIASITAKAEWQVLTRLEGLFKGLVGEKVLLQLTLGTEGITIITEDKVVDEIVNALGN